MVLADIVEYVLGAMLFLNYVWPLSYITNLLAFVFGYLYLRYEFVRTTVKKVLRSANSHLKIQDMYKQIQLRSK